MIKLSPRFFILPLLALVVIGSLPAPADSGAAPESVACGPGFASIKDPVIRASFARFERTQSETASRICAAYHNSMGAPHSR